MASPLQVDIDDLKMGPVIGRGSSSLVRRAIHKPSRTQLALKVCYINDSSNSLFRINNCFFQPGDQYVRQENERCDYQGNSNPLRCQVPSVRSYLNPLQLRITCSHQSD